jgi:hypothetical protein
MAVNGKGRHPGGDSPTSRGGSPGTNRPGRARAVKSQMRDGDAALLLMSQDLWRRFSPTGEWIRGGTPVQILRFHGGIPFAASDLTPPEHRGSAPARPERGRRKSTRSGAQQIRVADPMIRQDRRGLLPSRGPRRPSGPPRRRWRPVRFLIGRRRAPRLLTFRLSCPILAGVYGFPLCPGGSR